MDSHTTVTRKLSVSLWRFSWRRFTRYITNTNVNGGAIALGHPLGATGAMLTARLLNEMGRRPDSRYGMVECVLVSVWQPLYLEYVR